ncbi:MFS transporter [Frigidibacter sp. SD6-1]|uniref:MFS transporter n=1 Tax=Frigidibacter sp. SD6-1 TaxID=3032581 RepID=UPI0024E035C7|nr:MFS transporter [Frigidibacter sp. SD6-1]
MALRYVPLALKHPPKPKIQHFALLAGLEAAVRGTLISVMPLAVHEAMGGTLGASRIYFFAGIISLLWGLMVPWFTRRLPRRWMYTAGACLYLAGMTLALADTSVTVPLALLVNAMATATTFVCFNAYVLDYVDRAELGRGQSMQMVYAATPWAVGPMLGVWLYGYWRPLPFLMAGGFALALLTAFWILRLGNGKQIARAKGPAVNPLAYLARFFAQPRLIAGWLFAVIRSCGWWVYVVYLPYFCIEAGLGDTVGGIALSISNALLFISPLMLRLARRASVRLSVRTAFGLCGGLFLAAALLSPLPWLTVAACMGASIFLVMLDVVGGLPFLMSVKPSERTEMSAVYSSFRDVSSILTPGAAWAVLAVAPTAAIFAACGAAMGAAHLIAGRLHPRLGVQRPSRGGTVDAVG